MKTALKISLIMNLALLAGFVFSVGRLNQRRQAVVAPLVARVTTETSAPPVPVAAPPSSQQAEPPSFRWSQLYAQDYHDYVKNLRAVGCPEAAVRAIVTADVQAAYSFRAREIEHQLSDMDNSSWTNEVATFKDQAALKAELQNLPDEEAAEIADLLGLKPAEQASGQPSRRIRQSQQGRPISQPLVLQNIDLTALNLTGDQEQSISNIRQDFLQQIGGANQDPNDPAYLARWQQAQSIADNMLRAVLGHDAYSRYSLIVYQKTLENQAGQQ